MKWYIVLLFFMVGQVNAAGNIKKDSRLLRHYLLVTQEDCNNFKQLIEGDCKKGSKVISWQQQAERYLFKLDNGKIVCDEVLFNFLLNNDYMPEQNGYPIRMILNVDNVKLMQLLLNKGFDPTGLACIGSIQIKTLLTKWEESNPSGIKPAK